MGGGGWPDIASARQWPEPSAQRQCPMLAARGAGYTMPVSCERGDMQMICVNYCLRLSALSRCVS